MLHVCTHEHCTITDPGMWEVCITLPPINPTGGAAIMRKGPNLLKLARKEQCLALLTQLRTKFKTDGQFYRVFPNGEVQYLHPKVCR